jgi:hypothetical protein
MKKESYTDRATREGGENELRGSRDAQRAQRKMAKEDSRKKAPSKPKRAYSR